MAKLMMNIEESSGDESRLSTGSGYGSAGNDANTLIEHAVNQSARYNMKVFRRKPAIKNTKQQPENSGTVATSQSHKEGEELADSDEGSAQSSSMKKEFQNNNTRDVVEGFSVITKVGDSSTARLEKDANETTDNIRATLDNALMLSTSPAPSQASGAGEASAVNAAEAQTSI